MNLIARMFAIAWLFPSVLAAETAPSVASVQELLTVMESRKLVEGTLDQADAVMRESTAATLAGRNLNAEQRAIVDNLRTKSIAVLREAMRWQTLEPKFVEIYRSSFTQAEVDGMLDFYRSAAGRAVIAKMPGAMQRSLGMMHELVNGIAPQLRELQNDALEKLEAANGAGSGGADEPRDGAGS